MKEIKVIIGANYGDEGKGLMTDFFAHRASRENKSTIGILSNGGAQRGHTVKRSATEQHIFHHFSSGTLCYAKTYFAPQFMVNPIIFNSEAEELKSFRSDYGTAFASPKCRVTTIYDVLFNRLIEDTRTQRHGSCGLGIYETFNRNNTRYGFSLGDVYGNEDNLKRALLLTKEFFRKRAKDLNLPNDKSNEILDNEHLFFNYINNFFKMCDNVQLIYNEKMFFEDYDTGIIENGQGLLLDQDREGIHLTPSYTGARNLIDSFNKYYDFKDIPTELCYVTRTYLTRHGAGPLIGECSPSALNATKTIIDFTNETNDYQGTFRYGYMDKETLKKNICMDSDPFIKDSNIKRTIAITHLDETDWSFISPLGKEDLNFDDITDKVYCSDKPLLFF